MNTTILHMKEPNIHVFVTSFKNIPAMRVQILLSCHLKYGEGGTECENQDIGNGKVDQEDVDQGAEIIVGGHGETDEDIAQHSTQN